MLHDWFHQDDPMIMPDRDVAYSTITNQRGREIKERMRYDMHDRVEWMGR